MYYLKHKQKCFIGYKKVLLHAVVTKPRRGPLFAKKRAKLHIFKSVNKMALLSL
jgi:hypothetical protein